jgi:AAA+ superfamily predicted ATPase
VIDLTDPGRDDYREGNRRFEAGKMEEALAFYDRAVVAAPFNPTYRYNRGVTLMVLSRHHKALDDLHLALEIEPDKADIRFALGEVRSRMGEKELALVNYRESLARDPSQTDVVKAIDRLMTDHPPEGLLARQHSHIAPRISEERGEPAEARPSLNIPTVAEVAHPGNDETLVVAIERTLRASSQEDDPQAILKRAVLLSTLHRREAGPSWERLLRLPLIPNGDAELLGRTIRAYYEAGEWDEILRLQGPPAVPVSQEVARCCAHALVATGRPREAAQLLEGVREPSSKSLRALTGTYLMLGERERAKVTVAKAAQLSPRDVRTEALTSITDQTWFSSRRPLDDLGGLEGAKAQVRERVVLPLLVPELYLSAEVTNKFLMMGPPGCGKTTIARLAAKEAHAQRKTIHLTSVLNLYTGNSEANLTALFMEAKDATSEGPVVLLIDEVDSIAVRREALIQSGEHRLTNHFMDELDQLSRFPQLVVLAATNVPFDIDSAVLRSGRLGTPLYIGPPNAEVRQRLIEHHLKDFPHGEIDVPALAKELQWYSPADVEHAFAMLRFRANARHLSGTAGALTESEIRSVFRAIAPSVRNWFQRVLERVRADPSIQGFITGDLQRDLAEFQTTPQEEKLEKETGSGMFR